MYTMNFQSISGKLTLSARDKDLILNALSGTNPKLLETLVDEEEIIICDSTLGGNENKLDW